MRQSINRYDHKRLDLSGTGYTVAPSNTQTNRCELVLVALILSGRLSFKGGP